MIIRQVPLESGLLASFAHTSRTVDWGNAEPRRQNVHDDVGLQPNLLGRALGGYRPSEPQHHGALGSGEDAWHGRGTAPCASRVKHPTRANGSFHSGSGP